MRDRETALIGVEASLTGHLVLSTLHTNSAAETVTRLIEMGVDHFSFADAILGVIAQRLARRLCSKCRVQYRANEQEYQELAHYYDVEALRERMNGEPLQLWRGEGCEACGKTGYKGRIGVYELLVASDEVRAAIRNRAKSDQLLAVARQEGMATLLEDGVEKCLTGLTDVRSVLSVCGR
jgi:type II secretory ATPase GspE/PulE/Tfp pilus assembly ATPase PilB-like protein